MNIKRIVRIALMTSILSVLSLISIPIGPVPITLQTLGVFLCGFILGPLDGALSVILYLMLGASGVPVFSGGTAGLKILIGPTGGYLLSFPIAAYISGYGAGRFKNRMSVYAAGLLCIAVNYLIGVPYLAFIAHLSIQKALTVGAYPFIIPDIIKMIVAANVSSKVRKIVLKR